MKKVKMEAKRMVLFPIFNGEIEVPMDGVCSAADDTMQSLFMLNISHILLDAKLKK